MRATFFISSIALFLHAQGHVATSRCPARARKLVGLEASPVQTVVCRDPFSILKSAQFLADEMGDELPLKTGPGQTALFLASLMSPGSLPNPFADTRWEPQVYAARDSSGKVVGVVQTALANIAVAESKTTKPSKTFFSGHRC